MRGAHVLGTEWVEPRSPALHRLLIDNYILHSLICQYCGSLRSAAPQGSSTYAVVAGERQQRRARGRAIYLQKRPTSGARFGASFGSAHQFHGMSASEEAGSG